MSEEAQEQPTWQCPYCSMMTSEPWDGSTHRDVCPFATNWWTVGTDEPGPMCGLCRNRLKEGQSYRYIPLYIDPDPEEAEDGGVIIDRTLFILTEVCGDCADLRRVK